MKTVNLLFAGMGLSLAGVMFSPDADAAARKYPPHGYPCLGCHPCGNTYCDDRTNSRIAFNGNGAPVDKKYRYKSNIKNNLGEKGINQAGFKGAKNCPLGFYLLNGSCVTNSTVPPEAKIKTGPGKAVTGATNSGS